jgi:SAM-dependent methyltransferase
MQSRSRGLHRRLRLGKRCRARDLSLEQNCAMPRVTRTPSGGSARYDGLADWYEETARPSAELSRDALVELLGHREGMCLDLGCGTGLYGTVLESTGRRVIGVDVSRDQLRHAKTREAVAAADAALLPFRDGSFDDVACIWVHGDLDDLPAVLHEAARVLRAGGRLLLFGVHPCFNGPCVENGDDGGRIVHANYRQSGWHRNAPWWTEGGIRSTVGARHRTLAELLNDVLQSPLRLVRVEEPRDDPVPAVLALVAERP